MSVTRSVWSIIIVSCLAISPCAKAALETAEGKASTSVGMKNTAANKWALETDPAMPASCNVSAGPGTPPVTAYYASGTSDLYLTYDTNEFTIDTDSNGVPDLEDSTQGMSNFYVTTYRIDFYANPNGNPDPGPGDHPDSYSGTDASGLPLYPSILVTLDPQPNDPDAATATFEPDADGNLPDLNLPVGLIDQIDSNVTAGDLTDNPNASNDIFLYAFLFTGPVGVTTVEDPSANSVGVAADSTITFTDPTAPPGEMTMTASGPTGITGSVVPEPTGASLLAVSAFGLSRRRRSR